MVDMLRIDHKMDYAEGRGLNRGTGFRALRVVPESFARAPARPVVHAQRSGGAGVDDCEEDVAMRFLARTARAPAIAVTTSAKGVSQLFVRFAVKEDDAFVFPTERCRGLIDEVAARMATGDVESIVLVGADVLFEPRREAVAGRLDALLAFGALLEGLSTMRAPIIWRTRGGVHGPLPMSLSSALTSTAARLTVEIGVPTLDPRVAAALEGGRGAAPDERLRLASALSARGIPVHVVVEPMVPMLTDQPEQLKKLIAACVDAGVHRMSARYLVLTRTRARALSRRLSRMTRDLIRGVFADEPWRAADALAPSAAMHEPHKLLPPALRRLGHMRLKELGASFGLVVDVLDPATESEVLSREERVRRRVEGKERLRSRAGRGPVPQLDLFTRKSA
jgi:hypothetical protein